MDSASDASSGDEAAPGVDAASRRTFHRYMLHIAYLGSNFVGWQRQLEASASGKGSVQELVEDAVTAVLGVDRRVNVTSVSRTDAGTHALYVRAAIWRRVEDWRTHWLPSPLVDSNSGAFGWTRGCLWRGASSKRS